MPLCTSTESFPGIDCGEGPPVLFVHGAACDHRIWEPHVEYFASRNMRCIAPTLRWFGKTHWQPNGPEFSEKTHASDLLSIIEALGCGPTFLVGWSYGANVALRLAADRPDLVSGIAAYEPSSSGLITGEAMREAHKICMRDVFAPIAAAAIYGDELSVLTAFINALGGKGIFDNLPPNLRQICIENAHTLPLLMKSKSHHDVITSSQLADLPLQVHIARGVQSHDAWTLPSESASQISNVYGHLIDGADHLWPAKDPANFLSWLEGVIFSDALSFRQEAISA